MNVTYCTANPGISKKNHQYHLCYDINGSKYYLRPIVWCLCASKNWRYTVFTRQTFTPTGTRSVIQNVSQIIQYRTTPKIVSGVDMYSCYWGAYTNRKGIPAEVLVSRCTFLMTWCSLKNSRRLSNSRQKIPTDSGSENTASTLDSLVNHSP